MLGWLSRKVKNFIEDQKEFGKWLDEMFSPNLKPDHICSFPGCWEDAVVAYLDDGRELPIVQPKETSFFSREDREIICRAALRFLKHPFGCLRRWIRAQTENDDVRFRRVMLACGEHERARCVWMNETLKRRIAAGN